MTAVPILAVIALAGAIVAWVTWRRAADERQSVLHHQHALETLRHVADRGAPPPSPVGSERARRSRGPAAPDPVRPKASAAPSRGGGPQASASRAGVQTPVASAVPAGARAPGSAPSSSALRRRRASKAGGPTAVFVDDGGPLAAEGNGAHRVVAAPPGHAGGAWSDDGRAPVIRRRRLLLAGAAVAVALVVVLVVTLTSGGGAPSRVHAPHATATIGHGASTGARGGAPRRRQTTPAPTTAALLAPTTASAHRATYSVQTSNYTVAIGASGLCWVMATNAATGAVVWTGTLGAGVSRSVAATGNLDLRLGAASAVAVTVDGTPVQLPAGFQSPLDLVFEAT